MVGIGCEPRVDYSQCSDAHLRACPIFYKIALAPQLAVFTMSALSLSGDARRAYKRTVAPHVRPAWRVRLSRTLQNWQKDTVLQLRLGTLTFSGAAVLHHASLLSPYPWLPPLVIELAYNVYNIALVLTIATTLRYWQEFVRIVERQFGMLLSSDTLVDAMMKQIFTWKGRSGLGLFMSCFCFTTDLWGLRSNSPSTWRAAVQMQHFQFAAVCCIIAFSVLRIGKLQDNYICCILQKQNEVLQQDKAMLITMGRYSILFRLTYVANGFVWVACCGFCGLGGIFPDTFYEVAFWVFLYAIFNAVGCIFAVVCFLLSSVYARDVELRLHDLLSYCRGFVNRTPSAKERLLRGSANAFRMREVPLQAQKKRVSKDLFDACEYPCYVMSLANLQRYERLPTHEQALHDGTLRVLSKSSYWPCGSYCHFVSQVWIAHGHPDGDPCSGNQKLKWMQQVAPELLGGTAMSDDIFLWMDIFSVPQLNQGLQLKALKSLPSYAFLTGGFLPLVRDPQSIAAYQRRGWCQIECICALTPKLTQTGEWRTGPFPNTLKFEFFSEADHEVDVHLRLDSLKNPSDPTACDFTVESDRAAVVPIQATFARIMTLYEQSGGRSWQHTYDIGQRPEWLKILGETTPVDLERLLLADCVGSNPPGVCDDTVMLSCFV